MISAPSFRRCAGWLVVAGLLTGAPAARAGGPISVSLDGRPVAWSQARPIRYSVDRGPLGRFSNTEAAAWVAEALQRWAGVEGAQFSVEAAPPSAVDVTGDNFFSILFRLPEDQNLIIFDSDGTVFDTFLGLGAGSLIEGIGLPLRSDATTATLQQALVILNGRRSREYTPARMQALIQHELGHFLGLAHSQLNPQIKLDGDPANDALAPRMSYNDGPNSQPTLHVEDRAWIAALYPNRSAAPATGTIRGRVLLPDGKTGLQGIQVIARRDGDGETTAVSAVSGYLYKSPVGTGSRDASLQGFYELPGLPPGSYRLAIEPLADSPVLPPLHGFLPGGRRFWHESGPPAAQIAEASLVSVRAGQVVEGKDFVLEGIAPPVREVAEQEPNDSPELAQTLTLPAAVHGRASPRDASDPDLPLRLPGGRWDTITDWYRIVLREPTTLTATLTAAQATADLNLYLLTDLVPPTGGDTRLPFLPVARSLEPGTPPESFQVRMPAGIYFAGVSSAAPRAEGTGTPPSLVETGYQLTILATPSLDPPKADPDPPQIAWAVISDLAPGSLWVRWQTDQEANSVLYVGDPLRELGSPALARHHALQVTGLEAGTLCSLGIASRNDREESDTLPPLFARTAADTTGSSPELAVELWSALPQDQKQDEFLLVTRVSNRGHGPALHTRIDRLVLPAGWSFVAAPSLPLDLGQIGEGAFGVIAARVVRTSAEAAPLDLAVQGSYASSDGTLFTIGR